MPRVMPTVYGSDGHAHAYDGGPNLIVAASNASGIAKATATYLCDGTADDVEINAAIAALPAGGGKVVLSEGTFTVTAAITPTANTSIEGQGQLATAVKCETAGINVIEMHGADVNNFLTGITLSNFRIYTSGAVASIGLSLKYAKTNMFDNLDIRDFTSNAIRIQGCYDNRYRNVYISGCGHVATTKSAISLENLADQNVNNENFLQVFMEPYTYRALNIGADSGANIAHFNRFTACKFHGDETQTGPAIVIAGDMNIFTSLEISKTGAAATGVQITSAGVGNLFTDVVVGNDVGTVFDIDGDYNVVNGAHCAAEAVTFADISGAGNQLANLTLLGMTGEFITVSGNNNRLTGIGLQGGSETGMTISGHYNSLSDITMDSVPKGGIILSGNQNVLNGVSPFWVADTSGEACAVTGDGNQIFGGTFNGNDTETITFAAGADNNLVMGAQVGKAITNSGAGNRFIRVIGFVTENSGTGSIANGATTAVITHGLAVTPTVDDISVTLAENPTNTPGAIWVDTITATQFTVNCENDPGASGLDFGWRAMVL